jgi:hypothetical protein
MTRAERIEQAARDFLDLIDRLSGGEPSEQELSLRSALSETVAPPAPVDQPRGWVSVADLRAALPPAPEPEERCPECGVLPGFFHLGNCRAIWFGGTGLAPGKGDGRG